MPHALKISLKVIIQLSRLMWVQLVRLSLRKIKYYIICSLTIIMLYYWVKIVQYLLYILNSYTLIHTFIINTLYSRGTRYLLPINIYFFQRLSHSPTLFKIAQIPLVPLFSLGINGINIRVAITRPNVPQRERTSYGTQPSSP